MIVALMMIGVVVGTVAAVWVWLGFGLSLWWTLAVYAVAGGITCIASAGVAVIVSMVRSAGRDRVVGRHRVVRYEDCVPQPQA